MKGRKRTFPVVPKCLISVMCLLYLCTLLDSLAIILYHVCVQNAKIGSYIVTSKRNENRKFFKSPANVKSIVSSLC